MSAEPTEARGASRGRWLRAILVALGAVIGGLLLIAGLIALLFTIKNAKAKREAQPVFAEMEAAFSRVRLPNGYAVIRSERQGGYYDLLGYQSPGEYRVYAVPRDSRAVDELIGAVEAAGFSVPQEDQCSFIADHGPVNLYVEFHSKPEPIDIVGPVCSPEQWPHVYVLIEITDVAA